MATKTNIEWTDGTWNPWRGCDKVSPGCKNCYITRTPPFRVSGQKHGDPRIRASLAMQLAPLAWNKKPWVCDDCGYANSGVPNRYFCDNCRGHIEIDSSTLIEGFHRQKLVTTLHRRRVFSLSLGDWLDDKVPIEWLADMLDVIRRCLSLDFLLLTKRPENWTKRLTAVMDRSAQEAFYANDAEAGELSVLCANWLKGNAPCNIWLGVSVENQATADARIPLLLSIPAKRRFVSYEPALEAVNFEKFFWDKGMDRMWPKKKNESLNQIIVGGESGPQARAFNVEWARSTIAQCKAAGVACFIKQLGKWPYSTNWLAECDQWPGRSAIGRSLNPHSSDVFIGVHDSHGGDLAEWPAGLRVREFPTVNRA